MRFLPLVHAAMQELSFLPGTWPREIIRNNHRLDKDSRPAFRQAGVLLDTNAL
jgi:hypothetical protein